MKINCMHGFFKFEESRGGELSEFISLFGLNLTRIGDYFTFSKLAEVPDYSIAGKSFLGTTAIVTFAGDPWEIFEANGFVYNYDSGLIVPIVSITQRFSIDEAQNVFLSDGLILPGSLTDDGDRVRDYAAWFSNDRMKFKYSEVTYV